MSRHLRRDVVVFAAVAACGGAGRDRSAARAAIGADSAPVMLNQELPFRYPTALYEQQVQGNVTLRLVIDAAGEVVSESTRVTESSGYPGLDSAAVTGSRELRFRPAKASGTAVAVSVLFPVLFRHPGAPPLPGDSVLHRESGRGSRESRDTTR